MTPREKLAAAFVKARLMAPYFDAMLTGLVREERPGLGKSLGFPFATFAVTHDGVLLWEPEAVERWSVEQTAAVLLHEIGHLLRKHYDRSLAVGIDRTNFAERTMWNCAADAEINDDGIAGGWNLPDGQTRQGSVAGPGAAWRAWPAS